jgi:hypothetical protein
MDTSTDMRHSHKTKDIHHNHLFAQSFQGIDHHALWHIDGLWLIDYYQLKHNEQIRYGDIFA